MKKKNYKCCGKKYSIIKSSNFNFKCLKCKKNSTSNKALKCDCPNFKHSHKGKIHSINTMYADDPSNYSNLCKEALKEVIEYFDELWDDYYKSRW